MNRHEARQLLTNHIRSKHTVLWFEWDVTKQDGLDRALDAMLGMLEEAGIIEASKPHWLDRTDVEALSLHQAIDELKSLILSAESWVKEYQAYYNVRATDLSAQEAVQIIQRMPRFIALTERLTALSGN